MENSNNLVGKRLYIGRSLPLVGESQGSGIIGMLVSTRLGMLELLVSYFSYKFGGLVGLHKVTPSF